MTARVERTEIKDTATASAPSLLAAPSKKLQPDYTKLTPFLFKTVILQLDHDMKDKQVWTAGSSKVVKERAKPVASTSLFYALMARDQAQTGPMKREQLLYTFLEINEYAKANPDINLEPISKAIVMCMRFLVKQEKWKTQHVTQLFQKYYYLHQAIYGHLGTTAALVLGEKFLSTAYLSRKSQAFMDTVMVDDFTKIRDLVDEAARKSVFTLSDEIIKAIAKVVSNFPAVLEKRSYLAMSRNIDSIPGLAIFDAVAGLGEFRQNTIACKYIYMMYFRNVLLNCFSSSECKVVREEVTCGSQTYVVSFALHEEQNGDTRVKAIKYANASADDSEDAINACLFVDEYDEGTALEQEPNPDLSFTDLPLYQLDLISTRYAVRLQKVSHELRDQIVGIMSKKEWGSTRQTAIWYEKELQLVNIEWEVGNMLCRSALVGEYQTYLNSLDPNKYDDTYKRRLEMVYMAGYILTIEDFLQGWYRDPLYKRPTPQRNYADWQVTLKQACLDVIQAHKDSFKWLKKSIQTVGYAGNPDKIEDSPEIKEEKSAPSALCLGECIHLLKTALKDEEPIPVILAVVDMMVVGIENILKNCKVKEAMAILDICFMEYDGFPAEKIPEILTSSSTPRQQANELLSLLLQLESLEFGASKDQKKKILAFLNSKSL